jgi:hypothetical protein
LVRFANSDRRFFEDNWPQEILMSTEPRKGTGKATAAGDPNRLRVKWDDANMRSAYANVCNAVSTREEVVLLFGLNQSWHAGQKDVTVQLTDRIILSPHAAKRLQVLLSQLIKQHEDRFGPLDHAARPGEP